VNCAKLSPCLGLAGVRKIIAEAEADPTEAKISGCAALFCYTLKGPSSGLHSRAEPVLRLLLDRSLLLGVTKRSTGMEYLVYFNMFSMSLL
jgi:U3 small nucleolar RNA-associated protein 20